MAIFPSERTKRSRLVVTGAAGIVGTMLRGRLDHIAEEVVLSDLDHVETTGNEVSHPADVTDYAAMRDLLKGGGDLLHFGGQSVEASFERVRDANITGLYNTYEAARHEGVRRILFPSSNHAIGFHERETRLDADSLTRPDSLYGVSKVFGEGLARFYYDKFGMESLVVRIGSCFPEPSDRRQLATWLSIEDMIRLIERMVGAPRLGCPIVYGVSANDERWWDNSRTDYLGWRPQENAEGFREKVEAKTDVPDPNDPAVRFQGGAFVAAGIMDGNDA